MKQQALSYPRLKIHKSKFPNVGWLIVLSRTESNTWLVARVATGKEALSLVEDDLWLSQLRQAHGLPWRAIRG